MKLLNFDDAETNIEKKIEASQPDMSVEELQTRLHENRKKVLSSVVLLCSALIAVIALGMAWFVSNDRVSGSGNSVSAKASRVMVGTLKVEEEIDSEWQENRKLLDSLFSLLLGKEMEIDGQTYYVTDSGNLTLKLDENNSFDNHSKNMELAPGSQGVINFYVIPLDDGYTEFQFKINMVPFAVSERNDDERKQYIKENLDETIQNHILEALKGHILFFKQYDNENGYSQWQWLDSNQSENADNGENNKEVTVTIHASEYEDENHNQLQEFEANKAYKVTLYWVWPHVFENLIKTDKDVNGNLTSGNLFGTEQGAYGEIMSAMYEELINSRNQENQDSVPRRFFYNADGKKLNLTEDSSDNKAESFFKNLTPTQYSYLDEWYNAGDYLIGKNVEYLYLELTNSQ